MLETLQSLATNYPWVMTIMLVISIARAINKPLFALLHAYVDATPSIKDNEFLAKLESSKIYKAICWVLDYTLSIKLLVTEKK